MDVPDRSSSNESSPLARSASKEAAISDSSSQMPSAFPLAQLPDDAILKILPYLEGVCKPISNNWPTGKYRPRLVIFGAMDDEWYQTTKPSECSSGNFRDNNDTDTAEHRSRWTALCAMRLTCRRFSRLCANVSPSFSLFRLLKSHSISIGAMPDNISPPETIGSAKDGSLAIPLANDYERKMMAESEVTTAFLKPHMFRRRYDGQLSSLMRNYDPDSADEFKPVLHPKDWFGSMALQVHRAFEPMYLPTPYEAPLSCLQIVVSAQRHHCTLSNAIPITERVAYLLKRTNIDYSIDKWNRQIENDGEFQMRFRLQVALDGDDGLAEDVRPVRMLHFRSVLAQSASCVRPRTAADREQDPLNLSPFLIRKSTVVVTHLHVGLHMVYVETDDAELAAQLGLPGPQTGCSTITTLIETGARGIMEALTRPIQNPPYMLHRTNFYLKLAALVGFAVDTPQHSDEAIKDILRWLSAHSMVDYSGNAPNTDRTADNLHRMYSYSFMRNESPFDGPHSPSAILSTRFYSLDSQFGRFLRNGSSMNGDDLAASDGQVATSKPYLGHVAHNYYRSLEYILEQYRLKHILIPRLQELAKQELDASLIGPLARLCSRLRFVDQVEVEFQALEQTQQNSTALELVPISLYSTFDLPTSDPKIWLRFSYRCYPMAVALSILAPSTRDAWQWAAKNRVFLSYFHYGCSPFYVPTPDLSHLAKRRPLDVFTVNLLPTVEGAPLPSWTSDPLITNGTLASTSVNCLEDLENRECAFILRWDPSVKPEDWRQSVSPNMSGLPFDIGLIESLASSLGVPELTPNQFFTIIIRVFGQCMGRIPVVADTPKAHPLAASTFNMAHASPPKTFMQPLQPFSEAESSSASNESTSLTVCQNNFNNSTPLNANFINTPFGTSRANWKATSMREGVVGSTVPETNCSYLSINMLPAYSEASYEQLRWMDYNVLHPKSYGLQKLLTAPRKPLQKLHPSNIFVDPAVVGSYPNMMHRIYNERGFPFIAFMTSSKRYVLLQLIESAEVNFSTIDPSSDSSSSSKHSMKSSREDTPVYGLDHTAGEFPTDKSKYKYCLLLRRSHTSWIVSAHTDLQMALNAFTSRFSNLTGQYWAPEIPSVGWNIPKTTGHSKPGRFETEVDWVPSEWCQPTFLDYGCFYEHIPLVEPCNEQLRAFVPIAESLRYWARFYRIVQADLPNSLRMVKLALMNDEKGTDDRIMSLVEYGEWTRATGDVKATIEAIDIALLVDASHPLPWLAKADMMALASLQATDTRAELRYIEYALMLYRRYLTCAQRVHALNAQHNPSAFTPPQQQTQQSQQPADGAEGDRQEGEGNGGAAAGAPAAAPAGVARPGAAAPAGGVAAATQTSATPLNPLLAQTPSLTPPTLLSIIMHQNPLVPFTVATPSPVHMRRAKWAIGKLLHRIGRFEEAKVCYDDLLRKYFKRERLELTLDRSAVLLSLGKPKEAADSVEHALKKEGAAAHPLPHPYPRSVGSSSLYWNHYRVLKSRSYLLLSAAYLRCGAIDAAANSLRDHRMVEVVEPRAAILERVLRNARLASKPDTRTRMRQHGMQVLQQVIGQPDPQAQAQAQQMQQAVQAHQAAAQGAQNVAPGVGPIPHPGAPGAAVPGVAAVPQLVPIAPGAAGPVLAPAAGPPVAIVPPGGPAFLPIGRHNQRRRRRIEEDVIDPNMDLQHVEEAVLQFELGLSPGAAHSDPSNANRMEVIASEISEEDNAAALAAAEEAHILGGSSSPLPPTGLASSDPLLHSSDKASSSSGNHSPAPGPSTPDAMQIDVPDVNPTNSTTPRGHPHPESTSTEISLESVLDEVGEAQAASLSAVPRSPAKHRTPRHAAINPFDTPLSSISSATASSTPSSSAVPLGGLKKQPSSDSSPHPKTPSSPSREPSSEAGSSESVSQAFANVSLEAPPHSPSPTSVLTKSATNVIALRRTLGPRVYAPWEFYSSLLDRMIDLSAMVRKLLYPVLFYPLKDASWIPFSITQLKTARSILIELRQVIAEAKNPQPPKTAADYQRLIFDLEDRYFANMPDMRRHHISFFVSEEIKRIDQLLDASFSRDLLIQAMSKDPRRSLLAAAFSSNATDSNSVAPSFAERFVHQIFSVVTPPESPQRQYTTPTYKRSLTSIHNTVSYDVPENLNTPFPTKHFVELLAEHVLLSVVDKRSTHGAQLLNAAGHVMASELRIISVTRVHPPIPSPTLSSGRRWRNGPPTLLWLVVPACSLARVLLKGILLDDDRDFAYLDFSAAIPANFAPSVALLVEVRLGALFYCGPDQTALPPGFDSLAIVNRFSSFQEDEDDPPCLLPNHSDSSAALFRIFNQDQVGQVRYIVYM